VGLFSPSPNSFVGRTIEWLGVVEGRWSKLSGNIRGGIWLIIGGIFFTVMAALVKYLGSISELHVTEILFVRQVVIILLASPAVFRYFPHSFKTQRPELHLLRVCIAFFAIVLGFTSIIHLPLSDAITLSFSRTIFITILGIFILQEIVGVRRWAAVFVGMIGVMIVLKPTGLDSLNIYGLMAVIAAFAVALQRVLIRVLTRTDKPVTILSFQAFGTFVLLAPFAYHYWITPTIDELVILIAIGILTVLAQTVNIFAYRAGEVSLISILDYLRLLYAALLGILIFGDWPTLNVLVGAALIILTSLYTMRRSTGHIRTRHDQN